MKKHLRITFNSPVVLSFAMICLAALFLNSVSGGMMNRLLFSTYHSRISNPMTWLRFFTHVIGHSGWAHFAGNMSYILLLGPMLEEKYGSGKILGVISAAALATGLVNYIFFPGTALCGASGVCFAFILLSSFTGFSSGEIPVTFILVAVIFIGQQIIEGVTVNDSISNTAHIVGGIVGALFGFVLVKRNRE